MGVIMNEEQIRLMLDEAGQDTDYDENDSEVEDHVEVRDENTDTEPEGYSESELEDERGTLGKILKQSGIKLLHRRWAEDVYGI